MVCLSYRSYFISSAMSLLHQKMQEWHGWRNGITPIAQIWQDWSWQSAEKKSRVCLVKQQRCSLCCLKKLLFSDLFLFAINSEQFLTVVQLPLLWARKGNGPCLKGVLAHPSVVTLACSTVPPLYSLFPISHFSGENCVLKELWIKIYLGRIFTCTLLFCLQSLSFPTEAQKEQVLGFGVYSCLCWLVHWEKNKLDLTCHSHLVGGLD